MTATASVGGAGPWTTYLPHAAVGVLFVATILGGVLLTPPGAVPDTDGTVTAPEPTPGSPQPRPPAPEQPGSLVNVIPIMGGVILGGLLVLAAIRVGGLHAVRWTFLAVVGVIVTLLLAPLTGIVLAGVGGAGAAVLARVHPEWYVLDALALAAGVYIVSEFGQFAGPFPVIVLLVGLAAYDAYAVYGGGHMETIAARFGDLLVPMMYVVPRDPSVSLREVDLTAGDTPLAVLGLGDAVVPGLLAVSGGHFLEAPPLVPGTALNVPALGALVGSAIGYVGLVVLLVRVRRVHPGLPVLNAAVIAGYICGALLAGIPLGTALGV